MIEDRPFYAMAAVLAGLSAVAVLFGGLADLVSHDSSSFEIAIVIAIPLMAASGICTKKAAE